MALYPYFDDDGNPIELTADELVHKALMEEWTLCGDVKRALEEVMAPLIRAREDAIEECAVLMEQRASRFSFDKYEDAAAIRGLK